MVDFRRLQSQLRRAVSARISSGQISGSRLARMTDFRQPHITNFLHGKRGLSAEGMDRILAALEISVLDLIPPPSLARFAHLGADSEYESIPLVDANAVQLPFPPRSAIRDRAKFKRTFLQRLRPELVGRRDHWLRFVLMQAALEDAEVMYPRIPRGAVLLVDRHYNSLLAHRTGGVNIYVVRMRDGVMVRSLEIAGNHIVLRPEQRSAPLEMMAMDAKRRYAEKIVGRVSWVGNEV